ERQIQLIDLLKQRPRFSPDFKKWKRDTEVALSYIFGDYSRHSADFEQIHFPYLGSYSSRDREAYEKDADAYFQGRLEDARAILRSMVQEVQEYWDASMTSAPSTTAIHNESGQAKPSTREVFVVH